MSVPVAVCAIRKIVLVIHVVFSLVENMEKSLSEFGIQNGTRLKCDDFLQEYNINITLSQMSV